MKRCKRCDKPFMEDETIYNESYNYIGDLDEMYISEIGNVSVQHICPKCREDLGIKNLLGLGQ